MALSHRRTVWHFGLASSSSMVQGGMESRLASRLDPDKLRGASYRPERRLAGLLVLPLQGCSAAALMLLQHPPPPAAPPPPPAAAEQLLPAACSLWCDLPKVGSSDCCTCTWTRPNSPFLKLHRPRKLLHIGFTIREILRVIFHVMHLVSQAACPVVPKNHEG